MHYMHRFTPELWPFDPFRGSGSSTEHPNQIMTLIYERLGSTLEGLNTKTKSKFITNKLASFVFVALILPATVFPTVSKNVNTDTTSDITSESTLKLSTTSPNGLASTIKINEIKPGESVVDREARLKAEAEAAAKAAAQAATKRNTVSRERRVYNDPNFSEIYARAGAAYGVDPAILHAIHQVETGASGSDHTAISGAGATGPMQFLPSTWRRHGVDGNGDGVADIHNVEDAIFSAAAYLKACGYPNVQKAIWGYNPSSSYFNKVMRLALEYGYN